MMALTQEQIDEVCRFQMSLSREDEWLFYHLAWVAGDTDVITFEDKYAIMQKWDKMIQDDTPEEIKNSETA